MVALILSSLGGLRRSAVMCRFVLVAIGSTMAAPSICAQAIAPARMLLPTYPADSFVTPLIGAGFRFAATIERHALTSGALATRAPFAATVRVDTVFRAPRSVGELRGRTLTMLVLDTTALPRRTLVVFLAAGVSFGRGIVLHAKGQMLLESSVEKAAIGDSIAKGDSVLRVLAVRRNRDSADVVFVGTVLSVADSAIEGSQYSSEGEHDPLWREAQVRVEASYGLVTMSVPPGSQVRLLFPGSADMAYTHSPRLQTGSQSVFLARRASRLLRDPLAAISSNRTYFVVRPLDVLPAGDSTIVRPIVPP